MPITLFVRSADPTGATEAPRLTFDGMQRVVIGRGQSCDLRLPDPSVSHRHATLQAKGADFVLVDEGSTNGTFIGGVRLAPRTSRVLRSGDMIRVGRVWLEALVDQSPPTRDMANATRDLALALVSQAMARIGESTTATVRVVEGDADLGATLALEEEARAYVVGRAEECDLPIADASASREHLQIVRRGGAVLVRDLGSKNPAQLGETPLEATRDTVWRTALVLRVGRTVLALEEPVTAALSELEDAPDEALPSEGAPEPPPSSQVLRDRAEPPPSRDALGAPPTSNVGAAPIARVASTAPPPRRRQNNWSVTDLLVMLAALSVLGLSIAGLVWLLRG
jgi:pSer/pThr/pTyr-binding forkhead associated (FHA) protein